MAASFQIHRLLCTSPSDLNPEREIFESSVARFNEEVLMPHGVLFAPASLRTGFRANAHSGPVAANIRMVDFFVQIFGEQPADPAFQGFVELALDCVRDPAVPLRAASILFRKQAERDPAVEAFRQSCANDPRCRVVEFETDELPKVIREVLSAWFAQCPAVPAVVSQ